MNVKKEKNASEQKQFLYRKLYDELRSSILSGAYPQGDKMPSLRGLAKDRGLSLTTVEQAYDQLLVEGYIFVKPQSGYFVSNIKSAGFIDKKDELTEIEEKESPDSLLIYDDTCFDFNKWKKCASKVFTDYSGQLLFESDPQGEAALRYEISKYILRYRGVNASTGRIVIGAGTQQITSHLSRILQKMGIGIVALETPGYLPVQSMFRDAGFNIFHIPVSKDGVDIDKLPGNVSSAVYVSPSNQFPTGSVMPIGKRYEILNWAKHNRSIIIEDDYDSELRYFGKPVPSLKSLDKDNLVVYLGSFSSTLFPAIKISYMVLPEEMAAIFEYIKKEYTQTCSKAEQLTLALFMEQGYYSTGIKRLRTSCAAKLEKTVSWFEKNSDGMVTPRDTGSGLSLTINVKSSLSNEELAERARKIGIGVVPIDEMTDQKTNALSLYYSRIPIEIIDEVLEKLIGVWKE